MENAANKKQIKDSEGKLKRQRDQELDDLRVLLNMPAGRRFIWRMMEHCGPFKSVWHPSALIHYNSGKQDVGHFLMQEVVEARPEALIEMMKEKKDV